jgi:hypothetical protein
MSTISSDFSLRATAAALLTLFWLSSCTPTSVTSPRKSPHSAYSFEVPADYQTVYSRIAIRARERYGRTNIATYQPAVSAKLSPADQSATVTVWNAGGIGMRYMLSADIRPIDPSRAQVSISCAKSRYKREASLWEQWANTPLDAGKNDPNE